MLQIEAVFVLLVVRVCVCTNEKALGRGKRIVIKTNDEMNSIENHTGKEYRFANNYRTLFIHANWSEWRYSSGIDDDVILFAHTIHSVFFFHSFARFYKALNMEEMKKRREKRPRNTKPYMQIYMK